MTPDRDQTLLDLETIRAARVRIEPYSHRTPVLSSRSLDQASGARLLFKCENLQRSGAFKFRGACNAVWSLGADAAARGVVTHSSGNHGAALALAARTRGIAAHVVVPEGAVRTKLAAIEHYGARLHYCAPTMAAREASAERVRSETGAELIHPFTDPRVIAGQGTAALELIEEAGPLDALIAPVGGGGLISGSAIAAHGLDPRIALYAAEPSGADDAQRSLASGTRVTDQVPDTVCDGLRGIIGPLNFELMRRHRVEVLTVPDSDTIAALRLILERMKLVVEPSSAIALAAVLRHPEHFRGRCVGVILSGGNIDLDALAWR
jgi:threonine dehydratase